MKKLRTIFTAVIFSMLSVSAFACPQGMSMTGGTGPNHKGGKCVTTAHMQKHKANHEKNAEHKMMKMDHKAATPAPKTAAPQATMYENMQQNKIPEKQAPKP